MNRLAWIIALVLVVGLCSTSADAAKGSKKAKKNKPLSGTVTKVDGANFTIETKGKKAAEIVVATDSNTKFEKNDQPATLADVKVGSKVSVKSGASGAAKVIIKDKAKGEKKKNKNKGVTSTSNS